MDEWKNSQWVRQLHSNQIHLFQIHHCKKKPRSGPHEQYLQTLERLLAKSCYMEDRGVWRRATHSHITIWWQAMKHGNNGENNLVVPILRGVQIRTKTTSSDVLAAMFKSMVTAFHHWHLANRTEVANSVDDILRRNLDAGRAWCNTVRTFHWWRLAGPSSRACKKKRSACSGAGTHAPNMIRFLF